MLTDFKNSLSCLNEIIYFDDNQFLREKTKDAVRLQQYIDVAIELLKSTLNEEEKYFVRGTLGNLYRINGEPQKAINNLNFCLNYAQEGQLTSKEIVSLIRLGEALKYNNNHNEALNKFNQALERCQCNNMDNYIDYVHQHKGKCLMELSRLDEAEECFLEALRIRKQKGNPELISSTQAAIDLLYSY
ncbi:tetratricopeptide repeat protein [Virgibacillus sediminis]|uniref:Tetratricopeptide repeat protein n=1 Tax=Virgibacillus sediminis TaxID=202260 RepID=A0ABV7A3C0_9BACI